MHHGDANYKKIHVPKKCSVNGCEENSRKLGMCNMHYSRLMKYGDVNKKLIGHEKHGLVKTPEYISWRGMKARCYSKNGKSYASYGGRGITICDEWRNSFMAFLNDMGKRPEGATLDRIDNDGNYEPNNCRWATQTQQSINTRIRSNNTSGYRGVASGNRAWIAYINHNKKRHALGTFMTRELAAQAYNEAAIKYHGADAKLNIIETENL